jgi:Protein of unknown function (DUF3618)
MGKNPSELREEIGETRDRMDETVDAIVYRADFRARIRDVTWERARILRERTNDLRNRLGQMVPLVNDIPAPATGPGSIVRENPLSLFFGAAAVGFLLGSLLPLARLNRGPAEEPPLPQG